MVECPTRADTGAGRLDKNTWAQIEAWPPTLREFHIDVFESAIHHSWVLQHLGSIHYLPFVQLQVFAVRRLVHPVASLPFPPVGVAVPTVQKGYEPSMIPVELLEAIVDGETELRLRILRLDWWELGPNELDGLVKTCSALKALNVAISFPLVKMVCTDNGDDVADEISGHNDADYICWIRQSGTTGDRQSSQVQP